MKKASPNKSLLSSNRIAVLAFSAAIFFAVVGSLLIWPWATTLSKSMKRALSAPTLTRPIYVQSQTTFYLHGTGATNNPPTLFLDTIAPTATTEKFKDSTSISRNGGNPWKEVGTWTAASSATPATLAALSDFHAWLGLKNSDDQGTFFDLRVEAYKNNALLTSGQALCITGVSRPAANAKEVVVGFDTFSTTTFNGTSDELKLKVLTRVGTNAAGDSCGGHNNAVGLRVYFDAVARSSRFSATVEALDTTPPVLTVDQPLENAITGTTEIGVTGTFSDQSPTTITVNGVAATVQGNNFTATAPLTEGQNSLLVVATDAAGNHTDVTRHVVRDTVAPVITLINPDGQLTKDAQAVVSGTFVDATATTVVFNDVPVTVNGQSFSGTVSLTEGRNEVRVVATDAAGNRSEVTAVVTRDTVGPEITLASPAENLITDTTVIQVSGSVTDTTVTGVTINGEVVFVNDGLFSTAITVPEGTSQITVVAFDSLGNQSERIRTVIADATAPIVTDLAPVDGTLVEAHTVTIQGRVVDATTVTVKIGAVQATVAPDGTFVAANIPLAEGENTFQINATDVANNATEVELNLQGKDLTAPTAPEIFSFPSPTRLEEISIEGRAEPNVTVTITGGREVATTPAAASTGLFLAPVKLNSGGNTLNVTLTDAAGNNSPTVVLSITSNTQAPLPPNGQASYLNVSVGDGQRGLVGAEFPRPLIAVVKDKSGVAVSGVTITFTTVQGNGQFVGGGSTLAVQTDADGYARARYISGPTPGPQLIRADMTGNLYGPLTFSGESFASAPGQVTLVTGVVQDMNLRALPNVLVRVGGQQARTGVDGRFTIAGVAAGPHQLLEVIGRDQIPLPGRWPNISYDIDVIPGIDNNLGRPLFLPKVNGGIDLPLDANGIVTHDTPYDLPVEGGMPPVRVMARVGTRVTFPPDTTDRRFSVTRIPALRVPMPLEDGRASNLYISVQPSGAIFEPALEVTFPNLDQEPANSTVLLMSFDHDAGRYVKVGTATVSADGKTVTTNPGSGIRVGAWHALPPDPPQAEVTALAHLQVLGNPLLEGRHIDDVYGSGMGFSATVLTPRAAWHDSLELQLRLRFTVDRDAPPVRFAMDVGTQISNPQVKLKEVSFDDNYALRKDDNSESFRKPHWEASTDPNYKGEPVAYEDGKKMKVAAKFTLAADVVPTEKIMVKADGNGDYDIPATAAKFNKKDRIVELSATASPTAFTQDTIDYFDAMSLSWQVALDGVKFEDAGSSSNQMYVSLGKPLRPYHTVVDLGTRMLKGLKKTEEDAIIAAIWKPFSDRAVFKAGDTTTQLSYWKDHCKPVPTGTTEPPECFDPLGIVKFLDGRCEAWQEFFIDVLRVQNISATKFNIHAKPLGTRYVFTDIVIHPTNPAQNNAQPPFTFNGHAVVKLKGKLYDPSYGGEPFADLEAWENHSLHSARYFEDRNRPASRVVPNSVGSLETEEYVPPPPPAIPFPTP